MADIELNIPQIARVMNAICDKYDYENRKLGNETKASFSKRMLSEEFFYPAILQSELRINQEQKRQEIVNDISQNIIIT